MTASVSKQPSRKRKKPFNLDKTINQLRFEEALNQIPLMPPPTQAPSPLEQKVTVLLGRIERVTIHILDRLGALALKGAAALDNRRG